jgi:hypothetical protein
MRPLDTIHRVLAGQTVSPQELRFAGWLVLAWMLIDVIQFGDWMITKLVSPPVCTTERTNR